jgi:RNA polymerase sigma factor (sigma-70 family)
MDEDRELLRRYASTRDEGAFAELVRRHVSLVYTAALRRVNGDAGLAQDVTQTVFVALAREARALHGRPILAGWLYVTTRHAAANLLRTERRRQAREREAHAMQLTPDTNTAATDWERLRPELDSMMDELGAGERDAVLLRYFENRPYAEIGAALGVSEDAARMRVDRALEKLRGLLARRGVASTAATLGGILAANSAAGAPAGLAGTVTASALAAGTAAASTGLIAFMAMNKLMVGMAGVALLAGGTALYQYQGARQAEAELLAANRERAALRSQLQAQEEKVRAARLAAESLAAATKPSAGMNPHGNPAAARASASAATQPKAVATSFAGKMDILYANPEYMQLQMKQIALGLPLQYGLLYRTLQLSPEAITQFEALVLERQQALYDTFAAARSQGVSIDDPILRQMRDPVQGEIDGKLQALLGTAGYQAYRTYAEAGRGNARTAAGSLAGSLYYTDAPLTAAQASQLVEIIAANTPKASPATNKVMSPMPPPDWAAVYTLASQILTPAQLATLQATNERNAIGRQMTDLSDKLLQEAAAASSTPGGG